MARNSLQPGEIGKIRTVQVRPGLWRADASFCDRSGTKAWCRKSGRTETAARRALVDELTERIELDDHGGVVTASTLVKYAVEIYLTNRAGQSRPPGAAVAGSRPRAANLGTRVAARVPADLLHTGARVRRATRDRPCRCAGGTALPRGWRSPRVSAYDDRVLARQMATALELVPEGEPSGAAAVLAELAALVGLVGLVLAGHFVGTADPADRLYAALLDRQVATLALGRPGADATCQDGPPGDTPDLTGDETSKPAKKPELTASHSGSGQR